MTELTLQQELSNYVFYSGDPLSIELHNITESEGAVSFDFVEAPASGISTLKVKRGTSNDNSYYLLDGRKVNGQSLKKGIYLHQGKKIVIH